MSVSDIITPPGATPSSGGHYNNPRQASTDLYYPNNMGRFFFIAMEELLGKNGLNAVMNLAGLSRFINNYPPNNLEKKFSFANYAAINQAIEDFYGVRGSKGLLLRAGKVSLSRALTEYTAIAGVGNLGMRLMPQNIKVKIALGVVARTFSTISDQVSKFGTGTLSGAQITARTFSTISDQVSKVSDNEQGYIYENETCSMCWHRTVSSPCCHVAVGVLSEVLHWATGKNFRVTEVQCMGMGGPTCRFVIDKMPIE
jgi:V4R domain